MKLNEIQEKASEHLNGPAIVLAVPGAGKTTMLLYRTMKLIKRGVEPSRILSITFSKASATDMEKRFSNLFPTAKKCIFRTIHAFSYSIVREYCRKNGLKLKLIEEESNKKFEILNHIYFSVNNKMISEETLEIIINRICYYKNSLETPTKDEKDIENFAKIYLEYEKFKSKNGLLDFDDMIIKALEFLKKDEYLRRKIRGSFDYFQLDEGQDTSAAQFELLKYISKPNNNIFIVADDDQSIYGFRGANPNELFKLQEEFKDLKFYYMENNFRSSKNIVKASNDFIKHNTSRFKKEISTNNEFFEPIKIIKVIEPINQYEYIISEIRKNPKLSYAILYRNNLSVLGISEFFERNNIKFNVKGNKLKFFNHFVVRDILSILEFSNDIGNVHLFENIYYKIKGYISKRQVEFLKIENGTNVFRTLLRYPNLSTKYKNNIFELMEDFKKLKNLNLTKSIEFVINNLNYKDYLKELSRKFGFTYDSLIQYCNNLILISKNENNIDSLIGRLKQLEYIINTSKNNKENLTLSTIHSAKGLEFDSVFIIDLINGILPINKNNISEEERRLFYVGITRAKKYLTLLIPKYYNDRLISTSKFINELIEEK